MRKNTKTCNAAGFIENSSSGNESDHFNALYNHPLDGRQVVVIRQTWASDDSIIPEFLLSPVVLCILFHLV